jgi:hypothetical protein
MLAFWVILGSLGLRRTSSTPEGSEMLKNRSKKPFGVVLSCFELLNAIFRDFVHFLPILFEILT